MDTKWVFGIYGLFILPYGIYVISKKKASVRAKWPPFKTYELKNEAAILWGSLWVLVGIIFLFIGVASLLD